MGTRISNAIVLAAGLMALAGGGMAAAVTVDLEEFDQPPYSLGPESWWNGSDGSGGFVSQGATFNNSYDQTYGSWAGWSVSNVTDNATPGYENQYSAYPGGGADGSEFYGVGFMSEFNSIYPTVELPAGATPEYVQVTNTTYAALSMLQGDMVAKRFGGSTGDDPDWFRLTITGLDDEGGSAGEIEFYLADYRFEDNAQDYVVDEWVTVDLSGLSGARTLVFTLDSSDVGPWGMNTPAYVAIDSLTYVPEPGAMAALAIAAASVRRRQR